MKKTWVAHFAIVANDDPFILTQYFNIKWT